MYFWYYSTIDRFAATETRDRPPIEDVFSSIYYSGIEYYRYIPLDNISLDYLDKTLQDDPHEICFEINKVCNLMCPICIAGAGPHADSFLSFSKVNEILRKFKGTVMRITLTGGEPILHTEFFDFVRLALENAEGVVIATNGYQPAIFTNALHGLKPLVVTVSLQGSRDVHDRFVGRIGAFDRAIETIMHCIEQGHRVEVLTTAFIEAIKSLPDLIKYIGNIPINEHRINLVKTRGRIKWEFASWNDCKTAISQLRSHYKFSIKRKDQPFLFIGSDGKEEHRYGRESKCIRD